MEEKGGGRKEEKRWPAWAVATYYVGLLMFAVGYGYSLAGWVEVSVFVEMQQAEGVTEEERVWEGAGVVGF